jgi:hypothetical protein
MHRMGWLAHAIVDVALGIGLLIAGVHGHGDDYLVLDAAGGYLILATILTNGPGGLWKVIPRLFHRALDGAIALALFASPFIVWKFHVHVDVFATVMAEAVGVILLRDAVVSDHRLVPRRSARAGAGPGGPGGGGAGPGGTSPIETRAFESVPGGGQRAGRDFDKTARKLGRVSGRVSATVADQAPYAARRAGVVAGRARRAARAARRAGRSD